MKPKGVENAEAVREACRKALEALASADAQWTKTLESVAQAMEGLQGSFFLKTNPAIPATRACRHEAEEVERLAREGRSNELPDVLARLKATTERLLKDAKMEGIIIT